MFTAKNQLLLLSKVFKNLIIKQKLRKYVTASVIREGRGERGRQDSMDTLGTWDNRIELPVLLQQSIKHGIPIPKVLVDNVGIANLIGRRTTNEDRWLVFELEKNLLYCAVFDGHGGSFCAEFCNGHLPLHIDYWLQRGEKDLQNILRTSFIELNNAYARHLLHEPVADGYTCGTTATVCLLRNGNELVVGHVGDSRALLCRNGEARKLTIDHSPTTKAEKERIVKSNGNVVVDSYGRSLVNGRLAMTRSLGDLDLKPYGVCAHPDTRSMQVQHGKDSFLVLTTDGINCVLSDQEICDVINRFPDPQEAAGFLTDQALHFGSEDNATAIVVPFGSWGKLGSQSSNFYSFGRSMMRSSRFS